MIQRDAGDGTYLGYDEDEPRLAPKISAPEWLMTDALYASVLDSDPISGAITVRFTSEETGASVSVGSSGSGQLNINGDRYEEGSDNEAFAVMGLLDEAREGRKFIPAEG